MNDIGKVAITYGGIYDSTVTYEKMTSVTYDGSTYCSKQTTVGHTPVGDSSDQYWFLMAKGSKTSGDLFSPTEPEETEQITNDCWMQEY